MELVLVFCIGMFIGGLVFLWGFGVGHEIGHREGRHQEQEDRIRRATTGGIL